MLTFGCVSWWRFRQQKPMAFPFLRTPVHTKQLGPDFWPTNSKQVCFQVLITDVKIWMNKKHELVQTKSYMIPPVDWEIIVSIYKVHISAYLNIIYNVIKWSHYFPFPCQIWNSTSRTATLLRKNMVCVCIKMKASKTCLDLVDLRLKTKKTWGNL